MFENFHFLSSFDAYLAQTDARYPEDRNTFLRLQREETLYDVLCVLLGMGKQTSEKTLDVLWSTWVAGVVGSTSADLGSMLMISIGQGSRGNAMLSSGGSQRP